MLVWRTERANGIGVGGVISSISVHGVDGVGDDCMLLEKKKSGGMDGRKK